MDSGIKTYECEVTLHQQGTALVEAVNVKEAAEKARLANWDFADITGETRIGVRSVRLANE